MNKQCPELAVAQQVGGYVVPQGTAVPLKWRVSTSNAIKARGFIINTWILWWVIVFPTDDYTEQGLKWSAFAKGIAIPLKWHVPTAHAI